MSLWTTPRFALPAGLAVSDVHAKVADVQRRTQEATEKLRAACAHGPAHAFQQALEAARRLPHLAREAEEAQRRFERRAAAALEAAWAAAEGAPMQVQGSRCARS